MTNKMAVHYSSETPEHYTPAAIISAVVACMGGVDLDPCSPGAGLSNVPAITHYTQADDGLSQSWAGRVYMNPPYGRGFGPWVEKLCASYRSGAVSEAIALVPARTDTQWWQNFRDFPICFVAGRLKFGEAKNSAPFPSAVVYLGRGVERFRRAFADFGPIWGALDDTVNHCQQCGAALSGRAGALYCSARCRVAAHRAKASTPALVAVCAVCGAEFSPKRAGALYCSPSCKGKAYRRRRLEWQRRFLGRRPG